MAPIQGAQSDPLAPFDFGSGWGGGKKQMGLIKAHPLSFFSPKWPHKNGQNLRSN